MCLLTKLKGESVIISKFSIFPNMSSKPIFESAPVRESRLSWDLTEMQGR